MIGQFLSAVCPLLFPFEATLESLSKTKFIPRKNYDTGLLEDGILALPQDTVFLMDETKLLEGKMNEHAVDNIKALANLIEQQAVIYDF